MASQREFGQYFIALEDNYPIEEIYLKNLMN